MTIDLLNERRQFAEKRLSEVRTRVAVIPELTTIPNLSIYVTGSYGRLEAHQQSDLDLFFIADRGTRVKRATKTLLDAALIRIAGEMGFPEFSNDAQYLEIHQLDEILETLGGAADDFKNFFTARLLLLLESRPIHGDTAYRNILRSIIDAYFRDYHDHTGDFRPLFLVNDVLRFWKTLCLNYENRRNRPTDRAEKNKHHLRNLKLKFSRLLICFSTVIPLSVARTSSPEDVLQLTEMPPLERLARNLSGPEQIDIYNELTGLYSEFLQLSASPDVLDWMGDKSNRKNAFAKADKFGDMMFKLLKTSLRDTNELRSLII